MPEKAWKIKNKTENIAKILIYGDIVSNSWNEDDWTAKELDNELEKIKNVDELEIYINSGGGDAFEGFAIYNSIKRFKNRNDVKVKAYITGLAASISSVIPLAADEVIMDDNSFIMIHLPWIGMASGNANDFRDLADTLDMVTDSIIKAYKEKTDLDEEELREYMEEETWLNSEDAKELDFIDKVTDYGVAAKISGDTLIMNSVEFNLNNFKNIPNIKNNIRSARSSPRDVNYTETETSEWSAPTLEECIAGYWKHHPDANRPDEEITEVEEMPADMKSWIASLSFLGETNADNFGNLLILPVVNPDTFALNKDGVEAAKRLASQVEGISEDTVDEVRNYCDELLEEEFDENIDDKFEGGKDMPFKVFEEEEEFENFKNELLEGYVKAEEVLAKFNDVELEGENIEEIVDKVSKVKEELTEVKNELKEKEMEMEFKDRKEKLEEVGVEVSDKDKEEIVNMSEKTFKLLVKSNKEKMENKKDKKGDFMNINIDNEDEDLSTVAERL